MRKRAALLFLCFCLLFAEDTAIAYAGQGDPLDRIIPNEQEMGIVPGEKTLDYKAYPPDNYAWDLGYDFIEWKGWKPVMHNPFPILLNGLSNFLFYLNTLMVRFGIFLMQLGFHTDLVNAQLSVILPIMDGLKTSLFFRFLPFVLVLLAAWMIAVGYWKNQTTRLTSGTIGAVLVLAGGLWFMANAGQSIGWVSKTMDQLTQITMGSLAAPYQAVTGDQVQEGGLLSAADQQLIHTSNRIWKLFVDRPWTIGELNRENADDVRVTEEEAEEIQKLARDGEVELNVRPGEEWSHLLRQYAPSMPQRDILRKVLGSPNIDHGNHDDLVGHFWGGSAGTRFLIALLALLATFMLLLFVGTISLILVLAQEMALAIIILAPIVFLLGVFPERGFAFTRKWVAWLIGTLGTKVVYGFYLGLTLLISDIVARGSGLLVIQQIFVGLLFFCAFLFRKKILQHILSFFEAPTPHQMYHTTKAEVTQHWNETKESWNKTKESWNRTKDKAKQWWPKRKPKPESDEETE